MNILWKSLFAASVSMAGLNLFAEDAPKPVETAAPEPPKTESAVSKLVLDLSSADATVRDTSGKALMKELEAQIKETKKPYVPKIAEGLASDKPEVKSAALTELINTAEKIRKNHEKSWGEAQIKLASADAAQVLEGRKLMVALLETVIETQLVEKLIEDLASTDTATAAAAPQKLKEIGAPAAYSLANALEDERAVVKKHAMEILKALGPAAKDVATDLAFILDNDDKVTRRYAAAVLENLGPDAAEASSDLVGYLDNEEKSVRRAATNILKKIGPAAAEAASDCVDYLTDDDKNSRALATEVLLAIGPAAKECVESLADIVDDTDNDADSRERAANVLGAIGPDAAGALEILRKNHADTNEGVKTAIENAVIKIETPAGPKKEEVKKAEPKKE